jgi:hypothetical protein
LEGRALGKRKEEREMEERIIPQPQIEQGFCFFFIAQNLLKMGELKNCIEGEF